MIALFIVLYVFIAVGVRGVLLILIDRSVTAWSLWWNVAAWVFWPLTVLLGWIFAAAEVADAISRLARKAGGK